MNDFVKYVLADAALIGLLTTTFAFIVKKWVIQAFEYHFKTSFERDKAVVEIEKAKELGILQNQTTALPQLVELVYRLRNEFRQKLEMLTDPMVGYPGRYGPTSRFVGFGEELYLLTESLYKFRIFLDDSTFTVIHQTKRALQDANVLFNTLTRPPDQESPALQLTGASRDAALQEMFITQLDKIIPELKAHYQEVDRLYPEVVKRATVKMHTFLHDRK